jgi:hypothetical protein
MESTQSDHIQYTEGAVKKKTEGATDLKSDDASLKIRLANLQDSAELTQRELELRSHGWLGHISSG